MLARLNGALQSRCPVRIDPGDRTPAAILILIYQRGREHFIVFTERTRYVRTHKGQISFPGGSRDPEDHSLADTAIRECEEEIGLSKSSIKILGQLDDCLTHVSNYVITPFVGSIPGPLSFKINALETASIIETRVSDLYSATALAEGSEIVDDMIVPAYFYSYPQGEKVIWGATARILKQFLEIWHSVGNGPASS